MTNLQAFERLDELTEAFTQIEGAHDYWAVYIRPIGGGFPLVKAHDKELSVAIKQSVERWETK